MTKVKNQVYNEHKVNVKYFQKLEYAFDDWSFEQPIVELYAHRVIWYGSQTLTSMMLESRHGPQFRFVCIQLR